MSLATRCTACGTVFRVVEDQLKVSGGWVRCGRCNEVFDAAAALVDADAGGSAPDAHRQRVLEHLARPATPGPMAEVVATPGTMDDADRTERLQPSMPGSTSADRESIEATEATEVREAPPEAPGANGPAEGTPAPPATDDLRAEVRPEPATTGQKPGFVRAAERAARWQQPGMRAALLALALAASALLALQAAIEFRDGLAARWPASRVLLEPACRIAGCRVEPLRRIDGLVVRSSSLVRVERTALMRLTVVLQNRDRVELMLPALELVLNDAQGRALVRRVLRPAELGAQRETLAAGAELPLVATLGTGGQAVVGYTIEIFYP